jgi:hypothetical protein
VELEPFQQTLISVCVHASPRVTSSKQILNKIIPHFNKYNLISQKQALPLGVSLI